MATSIHRETAQIIPFPARSPRRLDIGRGIPVGRDAAVSVVDSCWYHEEALKESSAGSSEPAKPC